MGDRRIPLPWKSPLAGPGEYHGSRSTEEPAKEEPFVRDDHFRKKVLYETIHTVPLPPEPRRQAAERKEDPWEPRLRGGSGSNGRAAAQDNGDDSGESSLPDSESNTDGNGNSPRQTGSEPHPTLRPENLATTPDDASLNEHTQRWRERGPLQHYPSPITGGLGVAATAPKETSNTTPSSLPQQQQQPPATRNRDSRRYGVIFPLDLSPILAVDTDNETDVNNPGPHPDAHSPDSSTQPAQCTSGERRSEEEVEIEEAHRPLTNYVEWVDRERRPRRQPLKRIHGHKPDRRAVPQSEESAEGTFPASHSKRNDHGRCHYDPQADFGRPATSTRPTASTSNDSTTGTEIESEESHRSQHPSGQQPQQPGQDYQQGPQLRRSLPYRPQPRARHEELSNETAPV